MGRYNITIHIEANEDDLPIKIEEIRQSLAQTIAQDYSVFHDQHGYEDTAALVNKIVVDGRAWDPDTSTLKPYANGITPSVIDHLLNGRKIQAIKEIRENSYNAGAPLGLGEAKAVADNWKP